MIRDARSKAAPQVSLHSGSSISAAWQNVILPWFEMVSSVAWQSEESIAVTISSRSDALFFRRRLLDADIALLGLQFLTPATALAFLARETKIPSRENLRLLLAIAARPIRLQPRQRIERRA